MQTTIQSINFNNLKPCSGSYSKSFEQLCYQLAQNEFGDKGKFTPIDGSGGDGGIEFFLELPNGDIWGWQCKFFTDNGRLNTGSRKKQISSSLENAFRNYPKLTKWFLCLKTDLTQDSTTVKGKTTKGEYSWFKNELKEAIPTEQRDKIELVLWGESKLISFLSKTINTGIKTLFFGDLDLSNDWFKQRLEENINNLGKRYTPELHFDLPIANIFHGISRDKYFSKQFQSHFNNLIKDYNQVIYQLKDKNFEDYINEIDSSINTFKEKYNQINFAYLSIINNKELISILIRLKDIIEEFIEHLIYLEHEFKKEYYAKNKSDFYQQKFPAYAIYVMELQNSTNDFIDFLASPTVKLANAPFMLLTGEAGIGKSHLLADIATKRMQRNQLSILLLGQHFTDEEPWSQIKKQLHITYERDIFLAALNTKAQTTEGRILIIIDAINEGQGKKIWKQYIQGFISAIKRYPNLGLVFSMRTSYEKVLIPEQNDLTEIIHEGFAFHEYEVCKIFFDKYNIKQPSIPLLTPEFSNPLFLKLFCEGLNKKGLHEIPDGYEGISTILQFYLETINHNISEKHNISERYIIINKVVQAIASKIANGNKSYIEFEEAIEAITHINNNIINNISLFLEDLIKEGLLTENIYYDDYGNHIEGFYITYERFSDHLVCSQLLNNNFDRNNPQSSFAEGTKFYELLNDNYTAYNHQGLIEALSIQLPELTGMELYEVAPYAKEYYSIAKGFIESLIWRKKETITAKLRDYINEVIAQDDTLNEDFLNTILLITSYPNHYFNSDFLHKNLMKFSMADRDTWWANFIHYEYQSNSGGSIKRMIDWAWSENNRENIPNESIRLMAQTLFWFTTSSNRKLRDSTSKALICLLEERIDVLIQLIETFKDVNDPYVLQRVYAVAYGCAIRTNNINALKDLSNCIYKAVFHTEYVFPDILLRDYAKGIIDYALFKGHTFDFDLSKTKPPFKSDFPTAFPTDEDIKKYKDENITQQYHSSLFDIIESMRTNFNGPRYGNFGRYVFEYAFHNWKIKPQQLSNLAIKWIIEKYGYDIAKHGYFDRFTRYNENNPIERIGKKYQWIALHEMLARVSDNYPYYENNYKSDLEPSQYKGPWEPYVRDIDPTVVIKGKPENKNEKFWWNPIDYNAWDIPNKEWIFKTDDLPNPVEMISIFDENGIEWLILEITKRWAEIPFEETESYKKSEKHLMYNIRSYITKNNNHKQIIDWAKHKNFMGIRMPESGNRIEMYSREYYWAEATETFRDSYYYGNDWTEIYDSQTNEFIGDVSITTIEYVWEHHHDDSIEYTIRFYKPQELLFNMLDLQYSKIEGQLINKDGELICFDPSTTHPTDSCLIVRKDELMKKLEENNLNIFWTVSGDKMIDDIHTREEEEYLGRLDISEVVSYSNNILEHIPFYVEYK